MKAARVKSPTHLSDVSLFVVKSIVRLSPEAMIGLSFVL